MIERKELQNTEQFDKEWLELIQEAKKLGLSFDEIKTFLQQASSSTK